jgi:hypothetical protein
MPTPSDTLHAIRGAAEVNSAALSSIRDEIPGWSTLVDAWNPTTTKGILRDQLARAMAAYERARLEAEKLRLITTQAIDLLGTGGDPDALPPSVPWSTGELQIAFGVAGMPSPNKELGRYLVVENVDWDATLSRGEAEVAPTAQADVTFWTAAQPIARFRWEAGATMATVTILQAESVPGDVIVATAPLVQDVTFARFAGTLVGRRRGT